MAVDMTDWDRVKDRYHPEEDHKCSRKQCEYYSPTDWSDVTPQDAYDIGLASGGHEAYEEVLKAFSEKGSAGVEEWLEWMRPKTWDEWTAYEAAHPEKYN